MDKLKDKRLIVAFGHKKGVGKDTAAKFLDTYLRCETDFSVKHLSFAYKLKDIAYQLYYWADLQPGIYYETHREKKEKKLSKLNLTPREIWILMGNKIREIYEATWIDYIIQKINVDILIISDLRFRNEAIAIKKAKGTLIKIERNTTRSFDPAEVDLDNWTDWDLIIDNNGTLSDLNKKIEQLALNLMLGENNG